MSDFSEGEVRADFANNFGNELALAGFLEAFGLPNPAPRNPQTGKVEESTQAAWTRTFCIIAAHTSSISGLGDWQPPELFADLETLKESRAQFFAFAANRAFLVSYMKTLTARVFTRPAIAKANEQGTGEDSDFLAKTGSASTNTTSTAPPASAESPSLSPK